MTSTTMSSTSPDTPDEQSEAPAAPVIDPLTLSAAEIERLALGNIAQRAASGGKLSDQDWQRLEAARRREEPQPVDEAVALIEQQVRSLKKARKRVPAALAKLVREQALLEVAGHVWADVPAAAKELGVSLQSVRNWCEEAGVEHQRCAIAKAELYRWLWLRAEKQAQTAAGTVADEREQELRIAERQARLDERTRRLHAAANDAGREGVIRAVGEVRAALTGQLPALLADALAADDDRLTWEAAAKGIIIEQLRGICEQLAGEPRQETIL